MAQPIITPGRILFLAGNLMYSVGAFLADYNVTHVYNPRWPPHARFHNGQTMSLGVLLASMSLYLAFGPPSTGSKVEVKRNLFNAAIVGSFYCVAGLSAILYPGTAWKDPDIDVGGSQWIIFALCVLGVWAGYWLEVSRVEKAKVA